MNKDKFQDTYRQALAECVQSFPGEYGYPLAEVPAVCDRMFAAIERGSANFNGRAFRETAKRLGIKPTAKAIREFYSGVEPMTSEP